MLKVIKRRQYNFKKLISRGFGISSINLFYKIKDLDCYSWQDKYTLYYYFVIIEIRCAG